MHNAAQCNLMRRHQPAYRPLLSPLVQPSRFGQNIGAMFLIVTPYREKAPWQRDLYREKWRLLLVRPAQLASAMP